MRNRIFLLAALALVLWMPLLLGGEVVPTAPTGVTIPAGYRKWSLVAVSQRDDKDELRAILANPIAERAFQTNTLPFPDGAILAKLAWKRQKSSEFPNTFVTGEPQRFEFMIKDSLRWPGSGGWGFGRFVDGQPADQVAHATCWFCHQANVKNHDEVFTRYAP